MDNNKCDIDAGRAPSLHDLPVEIFAHIFLLVREPRASPSNDLDGDLEWIPTVTHVCSRWRSIALATPLLWNTIVTRGAEVERFWLPIMLERAAGAPLDVSVSLWSWSGPSEAQTVRETLELLLPYASTFRTVLFRSDFFPEEDPSLPALVSQCLVQMTDVVELSLLQPSLHESLAPAPFDGMALNWSGRLRRLFLDHVHFLPWNSPSYASLRAMELTRPKSPPTIIELFDILRACPLLEELKVECYDIRASPSDSLHDSHTVDLPHLQRICLRGPPALAQLVDRITVSRACKNIWITYYSSPEYGPGPSAAVYSYLIPAARLYHPFLPQVESLVFVSPSSGADTIYAAYGPSGSGYELRGGIQLDADDQETFPPMTHAAWEAWLRPFVRLSASTLVRLDIIYRFVHQFTEEMWAVALAGFPCLRSLDVDSRAGMDDLGPMGPMGNADILRVAAALQRVSGSGEGACTPRLLRLAFAYVVVDEEIVGPLVQMLEWRAARGAVPLSKLVLEPEWSKETKGQTLIHNQLHERLRELGVTVSDNIDEP